MSRSGQYMFTIRTVNFLHFFYVLCTGFLRPAKCSMSPLLNDGIFYPPPVRKIIVLSRRISNFENKQFYVSVLHRRNKARSVFRMLEMDNKRHRCFNLTSVFRNRA